MNEELLMEVLSQSRKKYGCVSEIGRMTKELAEAPVENDKAPPSFCWRCAAKKWLKRIPVKKISGFLEEAGIQDRERASECLALQKREYGKS